MLSSSNEFGKPGGLQLSSPLLRLVNPFSLSLRIP